MARGRGSLMHGYIVVIFMNRKLPINTIKRNQWDTCRRNERGQPMTELTTFWTLWSSESRWFWWSFSGAAGDDRMGNWQGWISNEEQTATLTTERPKSFNILSRLSPPTHPSDPPPRWAVVSLNSPGTPAIPRLLPLCPSSLYCHSISPSHSGSPSLFTLFSKYKSVWSTSINSDQKKKKTKLKKWILQFM